MTEPQEPDRKITGRRPKDTAASSSRERDLMWEVFYLAQTTYPYAPGAELSDTERGKINRATKEAKAAGFSVDDVHRAITAWPEAMGDSFITAMGLVGNLTRCLNVAAGSQVRWKMTEVDRAIAEYERRQFDG